ncbi:MAG: FHA domain-containing protein [Planctomycetes bacterium]|jgi:hypothetical protein|nr:FHA domain-containing protein [Planctomycetota bacterium]HON45541.1 FHA domain-containing protein [Planctomycetota bacterium]HPY75985.1 FHA domain-containing protein [Planctomycetota bacterium]HQB01509.1 FHA domain-containing protein [Planctomycetota bacterium]HRU52600.1 FHA domain-containing protein [Planctomycetota bacterium]
MNLGHLLDGLMQTYSLYKRYYYGQKQHNKILKEQRKPLHKILLQIYDLLPPHLQEDFRKKRLRNRELDLQLLMPELRTKILYKLIQGTKITVKIYHILFKFYGYYYSIQDLGLMFGENISWGKHFIRYLAKEEDKIPILVIITSDRVRSLFYIDDIPLIIGRNQSAHMIMIPDPLVSSPHCSMEKIENKIYIEDLQSRNGTYINENLLQEKTEILPTNKIRIGNTRLAITMIDKEI